jgi:hypothetical protein
MLRILSSATSIGPRAAEQAPFLYQPHVVNRMNMEQERRSEHGSACNRYIDVATEYFYPHARTHAQNITQTTNQLIDVYGEEHI